MYIVNLYPAALDKHEIKIISEILLYTFGKHIWIALIL